MLIAAVVFSAAACGRPAPRSHTIEIRGFTYLPATLEVAAGDTVVWINRDAVPHTVTGDGQTWDSGNLDAGQTWRMVATSSSGGPYYCVYHPTMRGAVRVAGEQGG